MQIKLHYLADKPEFINTCAEWAFKAWGKYNPANTMQRRIEAFTKHCNKDVIPITIIAINGDEIIGMASLREKDGLANDYTPWLGSLYVDEKYRGQGIGEKLIIEITRIATELNFKELYLLTYEETLPKWYASFGWQDIGKDEVMGNQVTVMKKLLS